MIQISGIGPVVSNVRRLQPSVAFYRDVLGVREAGRFGDTMVFFSSTSANHHNLAVYEVGSDAPFPDERAVGLRHVALNIGDGLEGLSPQCNEAAGAAALDSRDRSQGANRRAVVPARLEQRARRLSNGHGWALTIDGWRVLHGTSRTYV
jgi:catechol 2,3-dioxygenase-like lactoylglutathione lyase family enzyme